MKKGISVFLLSIFMLVFKSLFITLTQYTTKLLNIGTHVESNDKKTHTLKIQKHTKYRIHFMSLFQRHRDYHSRWIL
jgi:hypothetical protein